MNTNGILPKQPPESPAPNKEPPPAGQRTEEPTSRVWSFVISGVILALLLIDLFRGWRNDAVWAVMAAALGIDLYLRYRATKKRFYIVTVPLCGVLCLLFLLRYAGVIL